MKVILFVTIILAAGACAVKWKPSDSLEFYTFIPIHNKTQQSVVYRLVNDSPFLFQLSPLSRNCTDNGVSVNLVGEMTDPKNSYNFTITVDYTGFNLTGPYFCKIHAIDLYTNETIDLRIKITVDSNDCRYYPANTCGKNARCNPETQFCECLPNYYYYPDCDTYCEANTTCSGYGHCNRIGYCTCDNYHVGSNCSQYCDPATACSGKGQCETYGCICDKGYWGNKCEKKCDKCEHGDCDQLRGTCSCHDGYYGAGCEYTCDDCLKHGGGCSNTTQCLCPGLQYGDLCEHDRTLLVIASAIGGALLLILATFCITKRKYKHEHQGYEQVVN